MRAELLEAVRPLALKFAEQLVDVIATRFEGQLDAAIAVASSALASDLEDTWLASPPVRVAAPATKSPPKKRRTLRRARAVVADRRPCGCGARGRHARTCNLSTTPARAEAADPRPPQTPRVDRQPSPTSSPLSTPSPPPYQPLAPVARSRADIEAAVARTRAARSAAGMDARARPPRGAARPLAIDRVEEDARVEPALPTPAATFIF